MDSSLISCPWSQIGESEFLCPHVILGWRLLVQKLVQAWQGCLKSQLVGYKVVILLDVATWMQRLKISHVVWMFSCQVLKYHVSCFLKIVEMIDAFFESGFILSFG